MVVFSVLGYCLDVIIQVFYLICVWFVVRVQYMVVFSVLGYCLDVIIHVFLFNLCLICGKSSVYGSI